MFYREAFRTYQTFVSKFQNLLITSFHKLLTNARNLFILGSQEFLRLITHCLKRDKTKSPFQGWMGH